MANYVLVQISRNIDRPHQHNLLCDRKILLKSCDYGKAMQCLKQVIEPGDFYQERDLDSEPEPPISYIELLEEWERERQFDSGEL